MILRHSIKAVRDMKRNRGKKESTDLNLDPNHDLNLDQDLGLATSPVATDSVSSCIWHA